ncbi:MAG: ribonuclease J [Candidatus Pacebacteria bacterium]|nr:ribonuclease J [Candidatus Paceibacterota bacterium]MCF7857652.1 ribonuclease J [Candidatus Paceibacterota bacterium]
MEQQNTQPAKGTSRSSNFSRTRRPGARTPQRTTSPQGGTASRHTYTHGPRVQTNPPSRGGAPRSGSRQSDPARKTARRPRVQKNHSRTSPVLTHRLAIRDPKVPPIAPLTDMDSVRIIPLGGVEEVGKNMMALETADDILIFDAGFQFVSSENDAPGVNYILPNTQYLEENKDKIRGLIITHGHLDHIGGIPFLIERIGNPPIYTRYLTSLMILKRQEEFPHLPKITMNVVEPGVRIKIGNTYVKPFPVTHSIPDSMGISVETKHGNIVISGDLKLEHEDGEPSQIEKDTWGGLGKDNNILFIGDSTNAERDGFSIPETRVHTNIENIVRDIKGRLIVGTFASQFERMIRIIMICEKLGKKIVFEGRSIKTNLEIAELAGLLKIQKGTIIPIQDIGNYPSDRIVVLATGAQGEEFAALMRIATQRHKFITLNDRDTIMLSSSVIPGNELSVQTLKDNLYRRGVHIIHYRASDVHSTGHGNSGELVWIREQVKPKFFMPAYGYHSMLRCHAYANIEAGFPKENVILPDNGTVIDIKNGTELTILKGKVPSEIIMVDGFTVGAKQEVVIRDRQSLAEDGMFVIIATINTKTGTLRKSPDIISRGFVYLRENQQLLSEARILIKKTIEKNTAESHPIDLDFVKDEITQVVSGFLLQKTNKTPMVIPVLIGI